MSKIAFTAGAILFCLASGLFVANLRQAAACPGANSVSWEAASNECSDTNGAFSYSGPYLIWEFIEEPFIAGAEILTDVSYNIATVDYTPDMFTPTGCIGAQRIDISGTLTTGQTSGTLRTNGWAWDSGNPPPYGEATHQLTIN